MDRSGQAGRMDRSKKAWMDLREIEMIATERECTTNAHVSILKAELKDITIRLGVKVTDDVKHRNIQMNCYRDSNSQVNINSN